jgi:hypothetical protein
MTGLRHVASDESLEVLRLLAGRPRRSGADPTRMVCHLHVLLLEPLPGGAKKDLSAAQARKLLAGVRPKDVAGKTPKRAALELVTGLERVCARKKAANKQLVALIKHTGTGLSGLHGIGPSGAARLLAEVGDITRFPAKSHFASRTGTAPIDASSGSNVRHRLSRGGNRQINMTLHMMAVVQLRNPTQGRACHDRKAAAGKTPSEAMRCPTPRTLRHRLPHHARRSRHQRGDGPGRTPGKRLRLQHGRLTSPHQPFGQVTSRTRHRQAQNLTTESCLTQKGARCGRCLSGRHAYSYRPARPRIFWKSR